MHMHVQRYSYAKYYLRMSIRSSLGTASGQDVGGGRAVRLGVPGHLGDGQTVAHAGMLSVARTVIGEMLGEHRPGMVVRGARLSAVFGLVRLYGGEAIHPITAVM